LQLDKIYILPSLQNIEQARLISVFDHKQILGEASFCMREGRNTLDKSCKGISEYFDEKFQIIEKKKFEFLG
jgi:hypothetical protein